MNNNFYKKLILLKNILYINQEKDKKRIQEKYLKNKRYGNVVTRNAQKKINFHSVNAKLLNIAMWIV